ncbi:MAG: ABC transporter permease [Actinobacteria bacterium]|nr:ABC transporter permease [Actinomycetota bacterium]
MTDLPSATPDAALEQVDSELVRGHRLSRKRRLLPTGRWGDFIATTASLITALALVVALWWIAAIAFNDPNVLPSPEEVADRADELLTNGGDLGLVHNAQVSLIRILIGWGGGVIAGVAVGIAMVSNRWILGLLDPLIELGRPIPPLAFAPLLVIWFGIGELPKYMILGFTTFPIVAISTVAAVKGVDRNWILAAQSLGAGRLYVLRRVTIPAALPGILVSIRLANGLSWSSLVAAEIIASTSGLGWMILQAGRFLDTPTIFVGIITIGLLAFITDRVLRVAEAWLVPWRGKGAS